MMNRVYFAALLVLVSLALASVLLGRGEQEGPVGPPKWQALTSGEDYDELCYTTVAGSYICEDSCPAALNSICAEFASRTQTINACCVPFSALGSSDPAECMVEVLLMRDDVPPQE